MPGPRLILASASPRRQSLLRDAGYHFEIDAAEVDESAHPPGLPATIATFLADAKAKIVSARHPDDVVLAADTVVSFGDMMLGKPTDAAAAKKMLRLLSGTTHIVITGLCVMHASANFSRSAKAMSAVRMRLLTPAEVDHYISTGAWEGKAGGYGIQDPDPFVIRQAGSHTNIVGLPMKLTAQLLAEAGITPSSSMNAAPAILALLVAAVGWYYLFYSRAAGRLSSIEEERSNRLRVLLRRINAVLMLLMALGIAVAMYKFDTREKQEEFVLTVSAVLLLLLAAMVLGLIDLRLTWKLRQQMRERKR